jgi:murein DD-endopeptidase MepM/ murein hydrolase activator NlpD
MKPLHSLPRKHPDTDYSLSILYTIALILIPSPPTLVRSLIGGLLLFIEQPTTPPQPVIIDTVQAAEASTHSQSTISVSASAPIAKPEMLPPQPAAAPVALPPPAALVAEPAPQPSPSPMRAEPAGQPAAPSAGQPAAAPAPTVSATQQRQQEIERNLAEIVAKQRAAQKLQQEQAAATEAAKYAGAKEFGQAKKAATTPTLSKAAQAALLKKLNQKQAATGKPGAIANAAKPGTPGTTESATGDRSYVGRNATPLYAPSPGGYSTAMLPNAQPSLQFPIHLLGKTVQIIFPLAMQAPITSEFGWRIHPITGAPRFHRGLDLGAPYGTPILAAKTGRVETADFTDGYGLTVVIRHNNTQQTLYAHMSQILVKPGDWVQQGSIIGQVGSTGNSTGPHLHFEFLQMTSQGWMALDPAAVLNQSYALATKTPSVKLATTGQTLKLSASGVLDLSQATVATDLIPGYSLLADLNTPPAYDQPNAVLFPFAMLPTAVPELGWLLSPLMSNVLTPPDSLSALLAFTNPGVGQLPFTSAFQMVPGLQQAAQIATQPQNQPTHLHTLATLPAGVGANETQYGIHSSTTFQTALQPQPENPIAVTPGAMANGVLANRLTAYSEQVNPAGLSLSRAKPAAAIANPVLLARRSAGALAQPQAAPIKPTPIQPIKPLPLSRQQASRLPQLATLDLNQVNELINQRSRQSTSAPQP